MVVVALPLLAACHISIPFRIAQQYPAADVSLYLNTLLCQDPETWGALRQVVEA